MKIINKASFILVSLLTSQAWAEAPEGASLRSMTYNGIGCPFPSVDMGSQWNDAGGLVLNLPNMLAESEPGLPVAASRKNCNVTLDIAVPEGWQYALNSWEARGFVKLERDQRGEAGLAYFFEGSPVQRISRKFESPFEDLFVMKDLVPISSLQWSSCEAPKKLNVHTFVRITRATQQYPNARGWMELGTHWEGNPLQVGLVWKRCER